MKTLCIVICHCVGWQPVINAIPCICCGILALVMLYFLLRFVVAPLIANRNERKIKELNHEYEKEMSSLKKDNDELNEKVKRLNCPQDAEECQKQLVAEKDKNEKLIKENENLKKQIVELEKKTLEESNKAYLRIIENIVKCIH